MDDTCISYEDPSFRNYDRTNAECAVVNTLRRLGHHIRIIGVDKSVEPVVSILYKERPDLIFNLTESFNSIRKYDQNIAGLLELLGIPFTGTGSKGLLLCRDKALCKSILHENNINIPWFKKISINDSLQKEIEVHFPLVVKPLMEDGSDGISNGSYVTNLHDLKNRVKQIYNQYKSPSIVEEYIEGRELYVSIIGNESPDVLPIREIQFDHTKQGHPLLATYKVKWDKKYREKWNIKFSHAKISKDIHDYIKGESLKAFKCLNVEDYGRIDCRLTKENKLFVLEVNPNPSIAPSDELAHSAQKHGFCFRQLVDKIIGFTLNRFSNANFKKVA